jgi:hypothetical protein
MKILVRGWKECRNPPRLNRPAKRNVHRYINAGMKNLNAVPPTFTLIVFERSDYPGDLHDTASLDKYIGHKLQYCGINYDWETKGGMVQPCTPGPGKGYKKRVNSAYGHGFGKLLIFRLPEK